MIPTLQEAIAIEKFVLNVTVPILVETDKGASLYATGTLFEIEERKFIVTAKHIFEGLSDLTKLAFPENPLKGRLFTFGSFKLAKPTDENLDVAVMEIQEDQTISLLKRGWQFLTLRNIAMPSPTSFKGAFFLSGYPVSLANNPGCTLRGAFATAYTQRIAVVPSEVKQPVDQDLDLFFEYGHEGMSITGKQIRTPELPGTSGAAVWEYKPVVASIWNPESIVRVVGVQSSYVHSKYYRAKSWWAVAKVLEEIVPPVAESVRFKLRETQSFRQED